MNADPMGAQGPIQVISTLGEVGKKGDTKSKGWIDEWIKNLMKGVFLEWE